MHLKKTQDLKNIDYIDYKNIDYKLIYHSMHLNIHVSPNHSLRQIVNNIPLVVFAKIEIGSFCPKI